MHVRVIAACVFALSLLSSTPILAAKDDVRPLSDAERIMSQTAAAYLSRGPEAVYDQLAASSPLRKMSKSDALAEIEVRLGPPAGATWELSTVVPALRDEMAVFNVSFPSGADDTITFSTVNEGGTYKINQIKMLAEPSGVEPIFPRDDKKKSDAEESQSGPSSLPLFLGFIAMLLAGGGAFAMHANATAGRGLLAGAVGVLALGGFLGLHNDPRLLKTPDASAAAADSKSKDAYGRLGTLLPLRRAIAAGTGDVDALYRQAAIGGAAKDVAVIWKAAFDLQQMRVNDVERALSKFKNPSQTPMVEMLRARVAFFKSKESDAVVAYENAISLGPGRDGLWMETAQDLSTLGFDERAERYLRRSAKIGSRDANVYYQLAMLAAVHGREEDSEAALQKAWQLRPAQRAELVEASALWSTLRRPTVSSIIPLNTAAEATFASPSTSTRPIALPLEAQARISGDFLDVQIGQQELMIPGGASIAPQGSLLVDAGMWARVEEQKALQDFPQLVSMASNAGAFTQPQLRRRVMKCANALAEHSRWNDLLQLTNSLSPESELVPADLFVLRDIALQRTQHIPEAKLLLAQLVKSPVLQRRNNAQMFIEIGEMLSSLDEYDAAVKVLDRAAQVRQSAGIDERVLKIQMNKRLATKYEIVKTPHFEIHYPDDVPQQFAVNLGNVMEAEFTRVQKWVPVQNFRNVVVNVVWWREFRSTYTGSDFILGFYSGKITVPLAGIPDFYPPIVAILTHEMTHAMLAQATNDNAPHWFQEGVAQRVEGVPYHENAFNMYDDTKLLSVGLLDAVLRGSPDPEMIGEAYIVAQTVVRYIEATYGSAGLAKMIASYRDGASTEEAIQQLSGMSISDFDTKLRAWGRASTKVFDNHEIPDYMRPSSNSIRWSNHS